jgi:hypothetical protein
MLLEEAHMQTGTEGEAERPREVLKRGLVMLLFAVAFSAGHAVLNVLAVVQFLWLLFAGEPNRYLAGFGRSLASWLGDTARFLTCASDDRPFPWHPWPTG